MINITGLESENLYRFTDSILSEFIYNGNEFKINEDMGSQTIIKKYSKNDLSATEIFGEWYILTIERK